MKGLLLFFVLLSLFAQENTNPIIDNHAQTVQLYNSENNTWIIYSIPDEIEGELHFTWWGNGQYLFFTGEYDAFTGLWAIQDGEFTAIKPACEHIPDITGEGEWKFIQTIPDAPVYLCFTENDQRIRMPSLPTGDYLVHEKVSASPEQEWIVFMAAQQSDETTPYENHVFIYAYHIPTKQLNLMGKINEAYGWWELASFGKWVSSTKGSVTTGLYASWAPTTLYAFEVTRPNSLEFVLNGWIYSFINFSNRTDVPYYEYLETNALVTYESGSISTRIPCHFTRYDATGIHHLRLGYDCLGAEVKQITDEEYLTTVVHGPNAKRSTIIRFNIHTKEITEMITGEIERFHVSYENSNCLRVSFGKNGKIDLVDYIRDYKTFEMTMVYPPSPDIGKIRIRDVNLNTGQFGCHRPK